MKDKTRKRRIYQNNFMILVYIASKLEFTSMQIGKLTGFFVQRQFLSIQANKNVFSVVFTNQRLSPIN